MSERKKVNVNLFVAWIISIVATGGSLYFSEFLHFIPCTLCWYQRILMYPIVLLLGIATYENNVEIKRYALPFSFLGMSVSGYHYLLQHLPILQKTERCMVGVPCSGKYIDWLGFITIPFLAFIAFTGISLAILRIKNN